MAGESASLRVRLERLGAIGPAPAPAARRATVPQPPARGLLPHRLRLLEEGPALITEAAHPLRRSHGRARLTDLLRHPAGTLAGLSGEQALRELEWSELAFLDTETSGTAGGVGTCAFLFGVGYLEGDTLRVRQWFLRDFGREETLLESVGRFLAPFRGLVTFNGKAFDLPVVSARLRLCRLNLKLPEEAHLDLLHASRRVWRDRLTSCSLATLEAEILAHRREEDIPSWLIPQRYFDYLQNGDLGPLGPVFSHNLEDILSLAGLAAHLCRLVHQGPDDPREHLALGRHALRSRRLSQAARHLSAALRRSPSGRTRQEALRHLATVHRREGRIQQAIRCWRELSGLEPGIEAHVELAKLYEHRTGELEAALSEVDAARAKLTGRQWLGGRRRGEWLAQLEHRRRRLERKAAALR